MPDQAQQSNAEVVTIMTEFVFYPKLSKTMAENAHITVEHFLLDYYNDQNCSVSLGSVEPGTRNYVSDTYDVWKPELDGLIVKTQVAISYPHLLKGPDGIIAKTALLSPCILWASKRMSTAGVILPAKQERIEGRHIYGFSHSFAPGELVGDLSLRVEFYVKQPAFELSENESMLADEMGMLLGSPVDETVLEFDDKNMDFPIGEFSEPGGPLWKIELGEWEDPRIDRFSEENIQLLLNIAHPDCPKNTDHGFSNATVLAEILAEAYFLVFEKVRRFHEDAWGDIMHKSSNIEPGSICQVLLWISETSSKAFKWDTPDGMMFSIKEVVDKGFEMAMKND